MNFFRKVALCSALCVSALSASEGKEISEEAYLSVYPPTYYSSAHHALRKITLNDQNKYLIELEDSSVWKIQSNNGSCVRNWKTNDPLLITPNNRWFRSSHYVITNQSDTSSIEVDLFLGPAKKGPFSRTIVSINYDKREIYLSDKTRWEMSYLDQAIFKSWKVNDCLLIGTNDHFSFWDRISDALLINVSINNSVRAKQF